MKIKIGSGKFKFSFYAPLWLCAIPLKSFLNEKAADCNYDGNCKGSDLSVSLLTKELKKARKNFGHLKIIDVESASGEKVEITL
ncbi:MAG TPA: hypothetical protein IAB11_02480 [Candidatus Ornithoclostridium faecavium]|nr:hypothetical protein [Candidatus Ornithoclostridium faecavium]